MQLLIAKHGQKFPLVRQAVDHCHADVARHENPHEVAEGDVEFGRDPQPEALDQRAEEVPRVVDTKTRSR